MCSIENRKEFGTAIILAGGKSSRMGFDKQFLKIKEKRLLDEIIETLKSEFDDFIIVTNKPEYYKNSPYNIVTDEIKNKGPLAGIHSGLKESKSKYAYIIACDMPNINLNYIKYMKETIRNTEYQGVVTKKGNWLEPFNSFYSVDLIEELEERLLKEDRSIVKFLDKGKMFLIEESIALEYSPDWSMFKNLNTQKDVEDYLNK